MANTNLKEKSKNPFVEVATALKRKATVVSPKNLVIGDICYFSYPTGNYTVVVTETAKRGGPLWLAKTNNLLLFVYEYKGPKESLSVADFTKLVDELYPESKVPVLRYIHQRLRYQNKGSLHEGVHMDKLQKDKHIEPSEEITTLAEDLGLHNFKTFNVNKISRCFKLLKQ